MLLRLSLREGRSGSSTRSSVRTLQTQKQRSLGFLSTFPKDKKWTACCNMWDPLAWLQDLSLSTRHTCKCWGFCPLLWLLPLLNLCIPQSRPVHIVWTLPKMSCYTRCSNGDYLWWSGHSWWALLVFWWTFLRFLPFSSTTVTRKLLGYQIQRVIVSHAYL